MTGPHLHLILLVAAPAAALALVGLLFFHRNRVYATWAKIASIVTFIAASGWGGLHIVLMDSRSYPLTRDSHYKLVGIKGMLAGIAIGLSSAF